MGKHFLIEGSASSPFMEAHIYGNNDTSQKKSKSRRKRLEDVKKWSFLIKKDLLG